MLLPTICWVAIPVLQAFCGTKGFVISLIMGLAILVSIRICLMCVWYNAKYQASHYVVNKLVSSRYPAVETVIIISVKITCILKYYSTSIFIGNVFSPACVCFSYNYKQQECCSTILTFKEHLKIGLLFQSTLCWFLLNIFISICEVLIFYFILHQLYMLVSKDSSSKSNEAETSLTVPALPYPVVKPGSVAFLLSPTQLSS